MHTQEEPKKPRQMRFVSDSKAQASIEEVLGLYPEHAPIVLALHGTMGMEAIQKAHQRGYGQNAAKILAESPSLEEGIRNMVQHRRAQRPRRPMHK